MPPADEKLQEKIPFDVYAMMTIISFLLLCTSIWLVNDELRKWWYAGSVEGFTVAEHLTKVNEDPEKYGNYIMMTSEDETDIQELPDAPDPFQVTKWPEFFKAPDPEDQNKANMVDTADDHDNTKGVPEEELQKIDQWADPLAAPGEPDRAVPGEGAEGGAGEGEAAPAPAPEPAPAPPAEAPPADGGGGEAPTPE